MKDICQEKNVFRSAAKEKYKGQEGLKSGVREPQKLVFMNL